MSKRCRFLRFDNIFCLYDNSNCKFDKSEVFIRHVASSYHEICAKIHLHLLFPLQFPDEMGEKDTRWAVLADNSASLITWLKYLPRRVAHPGRDALAGALREGAAEGAVAAEAALLSQLLGTDGLSGSVSLLVAADEVVDAQVVDIDVVSDALT